MPPQMKSYYEFGRFRLDTRGGVLLQDGNQVALTPKLLDTLLVLVESNGQVVTKTDLIRRVWPDTHVEESNLAVNISHLRKLLGKREDGRDYILTFRKRGYRFSADVREIRMEEPEVCESIRHERIESDRLDLRRTRSSEDREAGQPVPASPERASANPACRFSRWRGALIGRISNTPLGRVLVVTGILALFISAAALLWRAQVRHSTLQVQTIAVLPFTNLKMEPEVDFLGFSLADAIISQLGNLESLNVRPSAAVLKYRNRQIDPREVAAELKVRNLLTGNFLKDGDDLRVTAQLIDVTGNRILWREVMSYKYGRLLAIQDQVVRQIIGGLRLTLSPRESEQLKRNLPTNARAYEFYLRGIDYHANGNFRVAREMYERSLELDPRFAPAFAYLGKSYAAGATRDFGGKENHERALEAYTKALEIDPGQIEARVFLASLLTDTNRVEEAVPLLRQVLSQNPNHAEARWELGYAYRYAGMLDESVAECEQARRLDPYVKIRYTAFNSYLYLGQYNKFIETLDAHDESAFNIFYRGYAYYHLKDNARALADFTRAYQLNPSFYSVMGKVLASAIEGSTSLGLSTLKDLVRQMDRRGICDPEVIYKVAQCYALLGDTQSALLHLERSIGGGFFCYPYLLRDPLLGTLRGDRKYPLLLARARDRHERFKSRFFQSPDHLTAAVKLLPR